MGQKRARGSVAVVIPCFNDGATLVDAVASAQSQDVPAEIIVVDDGSTDHATIALTELLEADGIRVIRQANEGPAPARMAGVRATEADYVFPLDADDLIAPRGLERLTAVLDRNPDVAAAWGSIQSFGHLEHVHRSRPTLDPWQVSYQNHLPICSLYRREAVLGRARRGWLAASRRLRGLGPLDVARRAGLAGNRHPRRDRALPRAERPAPSLCR
jgi:glycosyltransferase involved in cell wall biosynthesis